jgi:deoxycytidylate deaminase
MSKKRQHIKAVILDRKGRVLSVGYNSYIKTHPLQAKHARAAGQPLRVYLHAEISALIKCRGKPYKIRVERQNKDGQYMMAKPCSICQHAIKKSGIKFIEYSIGPESPRSFTP